MSKLGLPKAGKLFRTSHQQSPVLETIFHLQLKVIKNLPLLRNLPTLINKFIHPFTYLCLSDVWCACNAPGNVQGSGGNEHEKALVLTHWSLESNKLSLLKNRYASVRYSISVCINCNAETEKQMMVPLRNSIRKEDFTEEALWKA